MQRGRDMELTKKYFDADLKELTKIKKKINNWKEKGKDVTAFENEKNRIASRMSDQFREMYEGDYCLTGSDVASLLDVTESYLFLKLKDKLDFVKPPREAFEWIDEDIYLIEEDLCKFYVYMSNGNVLKEEDQKIYDHLKLKKKELKYLKRKKVFVSKDSVIRFLKEVVDVEIHNEKVVISKSSLTDEYSTKAMNKLIAEFKSALMDDCDENDDKVVSYTKLSDEVVEQILKRELKIYSANSIKECFVRDENFMGDTVHDTQFYRFLENRAAYSKLVIKSTVANLKKKAKNQSLVRYLMDVETERQVFNISDEDDLIVFSVPVKNYYEGIAQDFINFVNAENETVKEEETVI